MFHSKSRHWLQEALSFSIASTVLAAVIANAIITLKRLNDLDQDLRIIEAEQGYAE